MEAKRAGTATLKHDYLNFPDPWGHHFPPLAENTQSRLCFWTDLPSPTFSHDNLQQAHCMAGQKPGQIFSCLPGPRLPPPLQGCSQSLLMTPCQQQSDRTWVEPRRDAMQSFQWGKTSLPPVLLLLPKCCSFWSIHGGWALRQQTALPPLLDFGNESKLLSWESLWANQAGPGDWLSWEHPDHHIFSAAPSMDLACANSQTKPGSFSRDGFVQGLVPGGEKG